MIEIRPFGEEHAAATATLFLRAMRGRRDASSKALGEYFCEILLGNPWATPEIPSLVALENGNVIGALGVVPRPMLFRNRRIMVATLTQHMVHPDQRNTPAAMELLRTCFRGPQEMTWVDGASDPLHIFHRPFGSVPAPFYALHWVRIIRPIATGAEYLTRYGSVAQTLGTVSRPATRIVDFLVTRNRGLRIPASRFRATPATSDELFSVIQEIGWRDPLKPDYDSASFSWLIEQAARAKAFGRLQMRIVREASGEPCGWLVYFAKPNGGAYVLQLGRRRADQFEPVFHALLRDAWDLGCSMVKGLARPEYLTPLTKNFCLFRHPETYALVHSANADLLNVVRTGDAALSGLDGERWQRFAAEPWTS